MPINFPSNPSLNDTYSEGQRTWKFNGTAWNLDTSLLPVGPTGPTGPAGSSVNSTPSFTMVTVTGTTTNSTDVATKDYVDSQVSTATLTDTDGLSEGSVNLYYTDGRAVDAINAAGAISLTGDLTLSANTTITGSIIPSANNTYDLGAPGAIFRDLYLSGATLKIGGATIKTDANTGTIALVAAPTVDNPNPKALVVTGQGRTIAANTTGGAINFNTVAATLNTTSGFSGSYNDLTDKPTDLATTTYVDSAVANLVDSAPAALNTLNELAAALGDDSNFATTVTNSIATKQDALVSGTNIKTINSTSLLGSGNVSVQETLVSGTNIKTVNGTSILGSGNITIAAGADLSTSSINDLQDVTITSPTNGQVLKYNGSAWVNGTDSTGSGGGGGDLTAVASDITPDTTDTYDIGSTSLKFYRAYFSDSVVLGTATLGVSAGSLFTEDSMLIDDLLITENMIVPAATTVVDYYGDSGILQVDGSINCTGNWIRVPAGTEAERPITGLSGMIRFNETSGRFEGYGADAWAGLGGLEQDSDGNNVVTGNLVVTGDVISLSDIALKENVTQIDSALDIVEQLKGYYYNLKGEATRRVGLVAQNVEKALPEAVINSDGNKAVAYGNIVGVLIESIKELRAEIASLRSQLKG